MSGIYGEIMLVSLFGHILVPPCHKQGHVPACHRGCDIGQPVIFGRKAFDSGLGHTARFQFLLGYHAQDLQVVDKHAVVDTLVAGVLEERLVQQS